MLNQGMAFTVRSQGMGRFERNVLMLARDHAFIMYAKCRSDAQNNSENKQSKIVVLLSFQLNMAVQTK